MQVVQFRLEAIMIRRKFAQHPQSSSGNCYSCSMTTLLVICQPCRKSIECIGTTLCPLVCLVVLAGLRVIQVYIQGESQCTVSLKTNHNGTLRIQEVTEVSAKLCKSAWEAVRQQSSISFNVRCFHGSKIRNNIVDAASMPSLF